MNYSKLLVVLLLGIFLISLGSAADWTYDNVKKYDDKTKVLTVKDTFGLGSDILTAKLETPHIYYVDAGNSKIFQITINSFEDYEEIFKDFELQNIKDNNKKFERDIQLKYLTLKEKKDVNGTTYYEEEWTDWNGNMKKDEEITIGGFMNIAYGEQIEWIPNIAGIDVEEWAAVYATDIVAIAVDSIGTSGYCGALIMPRYNISLVNYTVNLSGTPPTKAYLATAAGAILLTVDIVGDTADFPTRPDLTVGINYYAVIDNDGNAWTKNFEHSNTYPQVKTHFNITGGINGDTSLPATPIDNNVLCGLSTITTSRDELPSIVLNSPSNDYGSNNPSIDFNTTISKHAPHNVTLFINNVGNETNDTGILGDYIFTKIFDEGEKSWKTQACNADGCVNSTSRNFTIDFDVPTISVESPTGIFNYLYEDYNMTLNFTPTDFGVIDNCLWEYNNTNTSIGCTNATKTAVGFGYEPGFNSGILYVNDTGNNVNSSSVSWSVKVVENSRTFNTTSYETKREILAINVTANSSLTAVTLDYNGTSYATTNSGGVYSTTLDVIEGVLNRTFNWNFTYIGSTIKSNYDYQNISSTVFTLCNATFTDDFLNISFKDENDLTVINASVPTSTFIHYIGGGTVSKTLTYSNVTVNYNYIFCSNVVDDLNVIPSLQYKQGTDYPQRIWNPSTQIYNSTLTNKILYLLKATDGIYVTYQVLDGTGGQLTGVNVNATRTIEGETVLVGTGQTDAAGLVTFWMNPDFVHTVSFEKSGYTGFTLNHFPTQTSYTVTLSGGSSSGITDYLRGVSWQVLPTLGINLEPNTFYNFNLTFNSSYWTLDSFGFNLYGDGSVIGGNSSTANFGTISNLINTSSYSHIIINYYWVINGTVTNATSGGWFIFNSTEGTGWSIKNLFTDLSTYSGQGIFGLTQNALNFIIFIIIFVSVGLVSYKFGITSPGAVSGMVFALVFLFDFALGMIDIGIGIAHFPTIFVGVVTVGLIVRESTT